MTKEEDLESTTGLVEDFSSFELDPRLTRVLAKQNILKPTLIQEKAIPLALAGKDLLARARTGSGKTLAYILPILHRLLTVSKSGIRALVMVPTKELARQVTETTLDLCHYCSKEITCMNMAGEESLQLQRSVLATNPNVLVSTPSRLLPHLDCQALSLTSLEFLVVDEADLVLSFGYSQDLERIVRDYLPKTVQTFLMSATLTTELETFKQLVLRSPAILRLEEADDMDEDGKGGGRKLSQYLIDCKVEDKFLLLYVILKLRFLSGKLLIFANSVERCVQVKLFLEQFGIKTCLLNPELPLLSRHHIVEEFNRGVYDIIIASDNNNSNANINGGGKVGTTDKREKKRIKTDKEAGVSRGVDFKRVDVVINFELPMNVDSYVHRVGRTARGGAKGTAISLVSLPDDEKIFKAIELDQATRGNSIIPHGFDLAQMEGFRYRCNDAFRAVTKAAIKKARLLAVKNEITKSEKLKSFFEARPKDLDLLRHDNSIGGGSIKVHSHLKHVPDYLIPGSLTKSQHDLINLPTPKGNLRVFKNKKPHNSQKKRPNALKSIKKR